VTSKCGCAPRPTRPGPMALSAQRAAAAVLRARAASAYAAAVYDVAAYAKAGAFAGAAEAITNLVPVPAWRVAPGATAAEKAVVAYRAAKAAYAKAAKASRAATEAAYDDATKATYAEYVRYPAEDRAKVLAQCADIVRKHYPAPPVLKKEAKS